MSRTIMDQTIMTRSITRLLITSQLVALFLAGAGLCALSGGASAQPRPVACPEGRLADGGCVNPRLAFLARQQAVCYSQFKLSYIACPGTLPAVDTRYKFPWNVLTERQTELNFILER